MRSGDRTCLYYIVAPELLFLLSKFFVTFVGIVTPVIRS